MRLRRGGFGRQIQPHPPDFSDYPEPLSRNGGFGFVLRIVPAILHVIFVHSVGVQNRRNRNGEETRVTKIQSVRDYLKDHPDAMSGEIAAALTKQGIKINAGHVANIKTKINKETATKKPVKKPATAVATAPAVVEKPTNGSTITLEQVKKVAHTINTIGGFQRVTEVLEVIKELGGVKKFRDLAEAMTVPSTDEIPF